MSRIPGLGLCHTCRGRMEQVSSTLSVCRSCAARPPGDGACLRGVDPLPPPPDEERLAVMEEAAVGPPPAPPDRDPGEWWLTVADFDSRCSTCDGPIAKGGDVVYRREPRSVLCRRCADAEGVTASQSRRRLDLARELEDAGIRISLF